ncbi:hypothetical protein [Bradyrhizobium cytisi]|uniref:Uncharacterized protein n=1 Tax=Bradyrhizobium cytisi TaxID=515489 RepID=A0A5S4WEW2_9BRAD|nr:hypothetical protein [Bradyrhizobium cytisi]TYL80153.1 hypothetical protein FXB38_24610 [Bradyrhizobium cytisi]
MLAVILVIAIGGGIVFAAARIVLGWVLPVPAMQAIDRTTSRAFTLFFKLVVVGLGAGILYLVWMVSHTQT